MQLSSIGPAKRGKMVRDLIELPLYQVGLKYELDKSYKDSMAVSNAVYRVFQQVRKDPEKFGLELETLTQVEDAMKKRTQIELRKKNQLTTLRETTDLKKHEEESKDLRTLVLEGRRKAYRILMRKLDRIGRTNKGLDEVNLSTLATTFGILFDKGQIVQGEATENVAVMAKIDQNLSPEAALSAILQMREANQIEKEAAKKK